MANKSTGKQLEITIDLQGSMFYTNNLVSFIFNNSINSKPYGEFIIIDTNSDALYEMTGNFGSIIFWCKAIRVRIRKNHTSQAIA